AKVETGSDEIGIERKRPLVRASRARRIAEHLQRDAMVEMRVAIGRRANEHWPERLPRSCAVAQRELRMTEHPQERDIPRRARETVVQHPDRAFGIAHGQ